MVTGTGRARTGTGFACCSNLPCGLGLVPNSQDTGRARTDTAQSCSIPLSLSLSIHFACYIVTHRMPSSMLVAPTREDEDEDEDVEGLCKGLPKRIDDLIASGGGRLKR